VSVMLGVQIGDGSVIAAHSVVTRDIPQNSFAGGVPARVIRKLELPDSWVRHGLPLGDQPVDRSLAETSLGLLLALASGAGKGEGINARSDPRWHSVTMGCAVQMLPVYLAGRGLGPAHPHGTCGDLV
jgi:hypothetical protein